MCKYFLNQWNFKVLGRRITCSSDSVNYKVAISERKNPPRYPWFGPVVLYQGLYNYRMFVKIRNVASGNQMIEFYNGKEEKEPSHTHTKKVRMAMLLSLHCILPNWIPVVMATVDPAVVVYQIFSDVIYLYDVTQWFRLLAVSLFSNGKRARGDWGKSVRWDPFPFRLIIIYAFALPPRSPDPR